MFLFIQSTKYIKYECITSYSFPSAAKIVASRELELTLPNNALFIIEERLDSCSPKIDLGLNSSALTLSSINPIVNSEIANTNVNSEVIVFNHRFLLN